MSTHELLDSVCPDELPDNVNAHKLPDTMSAHAVSMHRTLKHTHFGRLCARDARNDQTKKHHSATTPASFGARLDVAKGDATDGGNEQQEQGWAADEDVHEAGII